jgi:N-ethylmaleimide reductase
VIVLLGKIPGCHYNCREILPGAIALKSSALREATRGRVAIRISPLVQFNDMSDSDPTALAAHVAEQMSARHIAFFDLRHDQHDRPAEVALATLARARFHGVLMLNGGFDQASGEQAVSSGVAAAPRDTPITRGPPFRFSPTLLIT